MDQNPIGAGAEYSKMNAELKHTDTGFWTEWPGQLVNGTFPLRRLLGSTSRSAVFLTEHKTRSLPDAAIKFVRLDGRPPEPLLDQWSGAATLDHPSLVRLFETGRFRFAEQEYVFVVMEYADQTLAEILRHRALHPDELLEMLVPTLEAMTFLHRRHLVHLQLKPSNVMAVGDQLKLTSDTIRPLGQRAVGVTVAYDPPELKDNGITTAGDVWSLGATMVEALTQRTPSGSELRFEQDLPSSLPGGLRDTVRRCLSLRHTERPSVIELRSEYKGGTAASPQPEVRSPQPAQLQSPIQPQPAQPQPTIQSAPSHAQPPIQAQPRPQIQPQPAKPQPSTQSAPLQAQAPIQAQPRPEVQAQPTIQAQAQIQVPPSQLQPSIQSSQAQTPLQAQPRPQAQPTNQAQPRPQVPAPPSQPQPAIQPAPSQAQPTIQAQPRPQVQTELRPQLQPQPTQPQEQPPQTQSPHVPAQPPQAQVQPPRQRPAEVQPQLQSEQRPRSVTKDDALEELAPQGRTSPKRILLLLIIGAALAVSVMAWLDFRSPETPAATPQPKAAATPTPAPPTTIAKPAIDNSGTSSTTPVEQSQPLPAEASNSIVSEVIPTVPPKIQRDIEGRIYVTVRVLVNAAGDVTAVLMERPGPSKYFARLADNAAREWKFTPIEEEGDRVWLLNFRFTSDVVTVRATEQ